MKNRYKYLLKNTLWLLTLAVTPRLDPLYGQIRPVDNAPVNDPYQTTQSLLAGQRVMHIFDFEEKKLHNEILPMYWSKVSTRTGFPHYSKGRLDSTHQRSGQYGFLLIPDGGSVGYEYHPRRIPVKPGSDFQITGFVHFESASSCRAQISCTLTDRAGNVIDRSRHNSTLAGMQDQGPDGWARLEIYVPGNFPDARFLTITVWLLQEEQWNQDALIASPIFRRDVKALAWFDDITIFQMPRVTLRSNRPGNVFDAAEPTILQVEVQGVASLDYQADLTVQNAAAQLIHQEQWILTGIEGETTVKKIELPQLPAGLYHVRLAIYAADTLISDRRLTFAQLAPLSGPAGTSGIDFGILALDSDIKEWNTLYELTRLSNAKLIKLPVWRRQPDLPGAIFTEPAFDEKLFQMQKNNIQVMATFSEIPDSLALKMQAGQRSLLDLLSLDPEIWRPQVAYVLAQYALQVPYWQIGPEGGDLDQTWDPRIKSIIESMRVEFEKLVSNTVLAAPLNCMYQVAQAQIGTPRAALHISSTIPPQQIPDYLEDCRRRNLKSVWASIEPLDEKIYQREHRLCDFAKRVAFAKKGLAETVFINHPWQTRPSNVRQLVEPTELFLVFRTLADHLGAARFVTQFDLADGIPALLFDRAGTGCIITWNENYHSRRDESSNEVELYVGQAPVSVDLFGNSKPLAVSNELTRLQLDQWPVIITGVNTALAHMRSSIRLEPEILDASFLRQGAQLKFTNPFNMSISGRLRLLLNLPQYQNWVVDPPFINFSLRPGETLVQNLSIKFPRNELAGKKQLDALITLDADRSYQIIHSIPFEIRLAGVDLHTFARRAGQTDLFIQQVVTNVSEYEMTWNSFLDLPDGDRRERIVSHLQPGATVTKSYLIPNAAQWIGRYLRIGLDDPKGTRRYSYLFEIK